MNLKLWLAHPLTHSLDIDDSQTTHLRRRIIQEKLFVRRIYQEWYTNIVAALPPSHQPVLELGSGAGFLGDYIPNIITSEVFYCSEVRAILDGQQLPLVSNSLRAIVMTDVLHHIPRPRQFLAEAARCVQQNGVVIMIEPWVTPWSRLIYSRLHHEPFQPEAVAWEFPSSGPLSGANGALPWIIFQRDRALFLQEFPEWEIISLKPMMPFRYLVSGGISMRDLMPGWSFRFWRKLEMLLEPWTNQLAMFALIVLKRRIVPNSR